MIDKQKAIEEMATIINKTDCTAETFAYLKNALTEKQSFSGIDTQMFIDRKKAEALANAGYGNVPQALTEFAEYLKDYVGQVQDVGYEGIGKIDIDEKLKEFLANGDIS